MIISITGIAGSGKTTVAKMLAERLDLAFYSMGNLRGKMAQERGMTIDELNKLGEDQAFTDKEVDDYQKQLGESGESFVIDGRLSWHFIPHSFKVFLHTDLPEAARRVHQAGDERDDEDTPDTIMETMNMIKHRTASDCRRYQKHYDINYLNLDHYDLVLDTTDLSPDEVASRILEECPFTD